MTKITYYDEFDKIVAMQSFYKNIGYLRAIKYGKEFSKIIETNSFVINIDGATSKTYYTNE